MDPFTPIAATINSSLRIFEVTYQLKAVGEQTADVLKTTRHVDTNLNEARRLRRVKESLLNNNERNWIDGIIDDTENALRGVARLIEPARIDKATREGIDFGHRFLWVFRDNPQVRDKQARLSICHQSLTAVIACLYSKDTVAFATVQDKKKEEQPPPYDLQLQELFNWRNRRRRTKSFNGLQSVAVQSSMPRGPMSINLNVNSPTSSVPVQSDCFDKSSLLDNSHSATAIAEELHRPHSSHAKDASNRPMSVDAGPADRRPTASITSVVDLQKGDGRRPISPDNVPLNKPFANLTREAMIKQRQADEEATNSRLPYPMSPSDYKTDSRTASEASASIPNKKTSLFSSLELPGFDGNLPNFQTMDQFSCLDPSSTTSTAAIDTPHDPSLSSTIESCPSVSYNILGTRFDEADGPQLHTKQTKMWDEQYRHPLFSFSSFAPLASSNDDSQQIQSSYSSHKYPLSPDYEGLQSVAELGISAEGTSNKGQGPLANMECLAQNPRRSPPVSPGRVRRGGRSWLMYHASRSDLRHYSG